MKKKENRSVGKKSIDQSFIFANAISNVDIGNYAPRKQGQVMSEENK